MILPPHTIYPCLTAAVAGWQWALGKPIVDGLMAIYHGPGRGLTGPLWAAIMS